MAMLRGLDLENLTASRLFHALVAILLELSYEDKERKEAQRKVYNKLMELNVVTVRADSNDPLGLMTPPIPGLLEMPAGIEG